MRRIATLVVGAAVGLLVLASTACTGETTVTIQEPLSSGISVSGTGRVTVVPDIGVLNLGVEVTRPTVADARSEAARAMDAVRNSLTDNGVEDRDIATTYFYIQPQYDFSKPEAGSPTIIGFIVTNQVSAKVRQIDALSDTLDAAIAAGGDAMRVNGVSFEVDQPERYQNEARELAIADARARADQLAQLAGVQVGDVRSISESFDSQPPPVPVDRLAQAGADSTSISPGETEVMLTVSIVYEVR